MQIQVIRNIIANAADDENRSKRLAQTFINIAKANGKQPESEDIEGVVNYIRDYIEYVPTLLEATVAAAQKAAIVGQVYRSCRPRSRTFSTLMISSPIIQDFAD